MIYGEAEWRVRFRFHFPARIRPEKRPFWRRFRSGKWSGKTDVKPALSRKRSASRKPETLHNHCRPRLPNDLTKMSAVTLARGLLNGWQKGVINPWFASRIGSRFPSRIRSEKPLFWQRSRRGGRGFSTALIRPQRQSLQIVEFEAFLASRNSPG